MGQCIVISERPVTPKGINPEAKPDKKKILDYVFKDDFKKLDLLIPLSHQFSHEPVLLYPGCGADVIFPLEYAHRLFTPKQVRCIFVDKEHVFQQIVTILDDIGISFAQKGQTLQFYWKNMLVHLDVRHDDIFKLIPSLHFDIYFERAFRIMKSEYNNYESYVFQQLNNNGFIISDSGFQNVPLQKLKVAQALSSYKEMIIGKKE